MWINFARALKIYHNVDLKGILGLGSAMRGKLEGENYGFDVKASKLFTKSSTFQH
jgi:hypothetical protein